MSHPQLDLVLVILAEGQKYHFVVINIVRLRHQTLPNKVKLMRWV